MHAWEVQLATETGVLTREFRARWAPEKMSLTDVGLACAAEIIVFEKTPCKPVAVRLLNEVAA